MESSKELLKTYITTKIEGDRNLIKKNIEYDGKKLKYRSVFLRLKKHIDIFLKEEYYNRFIVMPGLRGLGKSTLIFQLYDYLLNQKGIENNRILYLSMDKFNQLFGENIYDAVNVFLREVHERTPITIDKKIFIFVDEAQYDEKWSLAGKILYDESKNIFMIFTGSSALDFEMNVDAVRRVKNEPIFPMNFKEYLLLKHRITPPKGISNMLREIIFTGNVDGSRKKELKIHENLGSLKAPLNKEYENYLISGGFPMTTLLSEFDIHWRTYKMIERIIEKDVSHYQSINNGTKSTIFKIITFLALQKPGELSESNLAKKIGVSSSLIHNLLNILEKTHLIFHVNPYGGAGKQVRKPFKYYFLSPSIRSSVNFMLGIYSPKNREFLGTLAENLVASYFFKMKETIYRPYGIFYPAEKGSVDFLLSSVTEEIIPVEVGIGKKNVKQVKKAINDYDSEYGILISNKTTFIKKEDDIIYLPITTFSFI